MRNYGFMIKIFLRFLEKIFLENNVKNILLHYYIIYINLFLNILFILDSKIIY